MNIVLKLLRKEFLLEFRQGYALGGIFLYVFSMIFVVYIASVKVPAPVWNVLFWLIMLFASINAVVKSFVAESGSRQLYYYQLAPPALILLSKILYNTLLLLLLGLIAFGAYSVVGGNPVRDYSLFLLAVLLGSSGFSIAFTFISAIAAKANNSATLMAILSFPTIIPILVTVIRISRLSLGIMTDTTYWVDIANLLAVDAILLTLTFILFPYVWKD